MPPGDHKLEVPPRPGKGLDFLFFFFLSLLGLAFGAIGDEVGAWVGLFVGLGLAWGLAERRRRRWVERRLATVERILIERGAVAEGRAPLPESRSIERPDRPAAAELRAPEAEPPPLVGPPASGIQQPEAAAPPREAPRRATEAFPPAPASPPVTPGAPAPLPLPLRAIKEFFSGDQALVRVGIIVLLIGAGFVVKYAVDHAYLPVELRLAGTALGGIALLALGWRLRHRRRAYAMSLEGGGVGILYVATTAALRLYELISPAMAFSLFVLLAVGSAVLAVVQNSLALALLGSLGGFLAPILASTGAGNHVALFSYYALLDAGIVAIAYFKTWRALNLVGFAFTFGIGTAWGVTRYVPELYASAQPFLILFFLMFLAVAVLFAWKQPAPRRGLVDGTLLFGLPIIAFSLQIGLVHDRELGAALSALALAAIYLGLATGLLRRAPQALRPMVEACFALGVVFLTLTLPLGLDAGWTSAGWALEGAGLVWIGVRQRRWLARATGMLLIIAAGFALLAAEPTAGLGWPLANTLHLGALLIAAAAYLAALLLHRSQAPERSLAYPLLLWGLLFASVSTVLEIAARTPSQYEAAALVVGFALLALLHEWLGARLAFRPMRALALLAWPTLLVMALAALDGRPHALLDLGWAAWPLALLGLGWMLWRGAHWPSKLVTVLHAGGVWLLALLLAPVLAWELQRLAGGEPTYWLVGLLLLPALLVGLIASRRARAHRPIATHPEAYLGLGLAPVGVALVVGLWSGLFVAGEATPLPYIPVLSPIDAAQAAGLLALLAWQRAVTPMGPDVARLMRVAAAALAVFWVSAMVVRTVHHVDGVPYRFDYLWTSPVLQAALAITWSILALGIMLLARKSGARAPWAVGAALLGVVVVKLVAVDLSQASVLARIVSFVGVGVLLLIIGYVAPVPPKVAAPRKVSTP